MSLFFYGCSGTGSQENESVATDTTAVQSLERDQIFEDPDVARWAIDRAYRKLAFEERKGFFIKDKIKKQSYRVELINMPKADFFPTGLETVYVGAWFKTLTDTDTFVVDFKLGWNAQAFDPQYKRQGTFEVLDHQIRSRNGQARYRWNRDGKYWTQELIPAS
ncbi:MAG: hypothetical protein ACFCUI_13965 [Bernardetiaceae bacterium]